jgi:hypothetical protein
VCGLAGMVSMWCGYYQEHKEKHLDESECQWHPADRWWMSRGIWSRATKDGPGTQRSLCHTAEVREHLLFREPWEFNLANDLYQ